MPLRCERHTNRTLITAAVLAAVVAMAGCAGPTGPVDEWFAHSRETTEKSITRERLELVGSMLDLRHAARRAEEKAALPEATSEDHAAADRARAQVRKVEDLLAELKKFDPASLRLSYQVIEQVRATPPGSRDEVVDVHVRVSGNTARRRPDGGLDVVAIPPGLSVWAFVVRKERDGKWRLVRPPSTPQDIDSQRERQQAQFVAEARAAAASSGPPAEWRRGLGVSDELSLAFTFEALRAAVDCLQRELGLMFSAMRLDAIQAADAAAARAGTSGLPGAPSGGPGTGSDATVRDVPRR
ncbi:MAG: hypothetical protein AB7K09_01595 [Planctomycetota bacterium]